MTRDIVPSRARPPTWSLRSTDAHRRVGTRRRHPQPCRHPCRGPAAARGGGYTHGDTRMSDGRLWGSMGVVYGARDLERGYTESHDRWIWGFRVPSGRRHRALDLDLDRGVTFPRCSPLRPPPRSPARESSLRRPRDAPSAPSPRARVSTTMNCSRPRCVIDVARARGGGERGTDAMIGFARASRFARRMCSNRDRSVGDDGDDGRVMRVGCEG